MDNNAKVILTSHLGRPKGEFNMKYSLAPVAKRISELLKGISEVKKIIKEIKVKELSQTDFKNYIYIIDLLMKNKKHINFDISDCVIKIKQRNPKIKKYDKLFKNKGTTENILYNIEIDNNELEAIKNIVNIFKERHIEREKNPSVFKTYFNDYNIGVNIFEPQKYNDEVQDFMLKEYLPLAKEIVISKNETLYEKVRHIKVLAHLAMVEKNEEILEDIYSTIHNSLEISSPDKFFGFGNMHYKNKNDLIINVMMCDVNLRAISLTEKNIKFILDKSYFRC